MNRLLLAIFTGLTGAAILHLVIIFMLPLLSANSAAAYIKDIAEPFKPVILGSDLTTGDRNPQLDPLFKTTLCRYDLSEGAARLTARGRPLYWSLSLHDQSGNVFFSANDRIVDNTNVDLVIANQQQLRLIRENTPDEVSEAIIAPTDSNLGFILLRVFSPDESWKSVVDAYLASIKCELLDF